MRKQIDHLLKSDVSGYKINQDTGLSQTIISDLRTGKRNMDNLSLKTAEILSDYANKKLNSQEDK